MKVKNSLYLSLMLLVASFGAVQQALAQIPCGPTIIPKAALFVNWPQFHYDTAHSGCNPYETALSTSTVGNLVLDWIGGTAGAIESSPTVENGVVYIGSDDHDIYPFKVSNGDTLGWVAITDGPIMSAPVVANGVLYEGPTISRSMLSTPLRAMGCGASPPLAL